MKKRALSITETGITIGVVAVIAILSVGLFTDGLKGVIANSGVKDLFTNNSTVQQEKTAYSSYDRDYTGTQIEVQVTGAQGLTQLRKKANNKALSLTDPDDFVKNAIEIAYLARVVEILTGEPYFCAYMDKNSDSHCKEFTTVKYTTSVSTALSIPEKKISNVALKTPNGKDAGAVLAIVNVPKDDNGYPTLTVEQKYKAIQELTAVIENLVTDKSVLLLVDNNTPVASTKKEIITPQGSILPNGEENFSSMLASSLDALIANRDECECSLIKGVRKFWHWFDSDDECEPYVKTRDIERAKEIINNADKQGYMSLSDYNELEKLTKKDNYNSPSASKIFGEIKFSSAQ